MQSQNDFSPVPNKQRIPVALSTTASALLLAVSLSACAPAGNGATQPVAAAGETALDQTRLCEVHDWRLNAGACKPGQKIVFLPKSWGNEQLPILFTAVNCDMRYQVALTNGGVVCIYGPIKPADEAPTPAASAASGG